MKKFLMDITLIVCCLTLLSACDDSEKNSGMPVIASETAASEITASEETVTEMPVFATRMSAAETSETASVTTVAEKITSVSVTDTPEETAVSSEADDEVNNDYPTKIIYADMQETAVQVEMKSFEKELFSADGKYPSVLISAEYPVISGADETVCQKINDGISEYINSNADEMGPMAEDPFGEMYDDDALQDMIDKYKHFWYMDIYTAKEDGYDINGNVFTVNFISDLVPCGAAHGGSTVVPLIFDLRTGEKIDISELVEDEDDLNTAVHRGIRDRVFNSTVISFEITADEALELLAERNPSYNTSPLENERLTVYGGCLGYYIIPYEFGGSYADGIRRADIPIDDIIPYLNEKGKDLFEGYVSAETVPAGIVERDGKKYFDIE